jgi:hypothetical protein
VGARSRHGRRHPDLGNFASYAGSETVGRGRQRKPATGWVRTAPRPSDWHAAGTATSYVNNVYSATTNGVAGGWKLTSADSKIAKTITLGATSTWFAVQYVVDPALGTLTSAAASRRTSKACCCTARPISAANSTPTRFDAFEPGSRPKSRAKVAYGGSYSATCNTNAVDGVDLDTLRMRNQAQTHQGRAVRKRHVHLRHRLRSADGEQYNDACRTRGSALRV